MISKDKYKSIFKVKWRLLFLSSFKYFSQHAQFLKIGEYHSDIAQPEHIQSRDAFRPIASELKYLMDYNY